MTEYVSSDSIIASTVREPASLTSTRDGAARRRRRGLVAEPVVAGIVALIDATMIVACGLATLDSIADRLAMADKHFAMVAMLLAAILAVNLALKGKGYRFEALRDWRAASIPATIAWTASVALIAAILYVAAIPQVELFPWIVGWWLSALAALVALRPAVGHVVAGWAQAGRFTRRIAILGDTPVAERLMRRLEGDVAGSVSVVGIYEDRQRGAARPGTGLRVCGSSDDLIFDIRRNEIDTVIVALPLGADRRLTHVVGKLGQTPVEVILCPEWFDLQAGACRMKPIGAIPFLQALTPPLRAWRAIAKEVEDRVLAAFILVLISPLLAAIAVAIKLDSPGPVFFRQKRYGYNNQLIEMFKFRSMYHHARDLNAEQLTRRNDPRITRVGAFIRRTSLDELPQFINVLRGEMSIVGPRPHALAAKAAGTLYPDAVPSYHARHRMKPGITGWAQVNGWRGETETVEQIVKRVEHDLYYVEHWSVLFDMRIILRTVFSGFTGHQAF